ncbi:FxLYD domain-containing protein [Coleofasciculus sp. H7-2]|uniref:FxLYD domain-containing protein n=1 Tax=Coleofasciculus sp. H7-2 TaxID=3351545 RepID=UPI003671BB89
MNTSLVFLPAIVTMQKSLHLTIFLWIASILFVNHHSSSNSWMANFQAAGASASEIDMPFCYIQTSDGRTLDLTQLCGQKPQVIIADQTSDGDILTGRIINETQKTVHSIEVSYNVVGFDGKVIKSSSVNAEPSTLSAGQSGSFKVHTIVGDGKLRATSVNWEE